MSMTRKRGIALRPEFLRRDENAPAGPKCARERDRPVGRIAIERHVYTTGPAEQRQPRRLPAARPIQTACPGILESRHKHGQRIRNALAQDHRSLPGIAGIVQVADRDGQVEVRASPGGRGVRAALEVDDAALNHVRKQNIPGILPSEEVSHSTRFVLNHEPCLDRLLKDLGPV